MNKKYIIPVALLTSMTILQSPAYSQLTLPTVTPNQTFGFQPNPNPGQPASGGGFNPNPAPTPRGQPGLSDMMNAWEQETDPTKKRRLARQIQTRVGVPADGVIGRQTMQAIQQSGGMPGGGGMGGPAPGGGFNPNPGQPAQGGFFGNLFGSRPAQPGAQGVNNLMREWVMEPDPNKK